ncbi:hypothetical protein [Arthrobacter mobilis]|uniref:Centromere-binding protein ParB C-terminal domain-containing protein n=1 Tax=Arthrobacter mobilis TaxID=2724944 RepID=A0A7X6K5M6_9MICC|nr:hypothetical protein [Arthrobacter mobilis]NKX55930.1 hypothetical protein [Arthrobacter mobilis]
MSPTPPPVARGGSDNPLAKFKRGGLKKAAGSGVVAEMIGAKEYEPPAAEEHQPETAPDTRTATEPPAADAAPVHVLETQPVQVGESAPAPAPLPTMSAPQEAPQPPAQEYVQSLPAPLQAYAASPAAAPAQQPSVQGPIEPHAQAPQPQVQAVPLQGNVSPAAAPAPVPSIPLQPTLQELPAPPKSKKTSFHQPIDSGNRMRSTYNATRHLTKYLTMSEFVCAAVDKMCAELEEKYNDGERFDADPGAVPKGRPVGS